MSVDPCDPCGCVSGNMNEQVFFQSAVNLLCDIRTNTGGGGGVEADVNLNQVGGVAITLGQKAMAASIPVVIASNQSSFPVTIAAGSAVIGHVITDTGSTTAVTQATASSLNAQVVGEIASGSADSGNPQKIGGVARITNPTAVTDGQRVNGIFDKLGKQICVGAIRDLKGVTQTSVSNTTTETTIVAAVASTFLDIYGLVFANTGASTTKVTVKDATAGTTRMVFEVPTLDTRGFMVAVDSAVPQSATNNNWTVTCGTATTALEVTALWVKNI